MVLYLLYVKAELENVESLEMTPETLWHLDVSDSTGQDVRKGVVLSEKDVIPIAGGRSHANFVLTWPGAKKASQITIVRDVKNVTRSIQMGDSGQYVPIVGFECRGLEPIAWSPIGDFQIKASGGSMFSADDLRDDWSEFDEETQLALGIFDVVGEFRVSN